MYLAIVFLAAYNPRALGSTFGFIISLTIAIVVVGNTEVQGRSQVSQMRFDEASNVEGNVVVAYFNRNFKIIRFQSKTPLIIGIFSAEVLAQGHRREYVLVNKAFLGKMNGNGTFWSLVL